MPEGNEVNAVDWKEEYGRKHALLIERGFQEYAPQEFYRELFPQGTLQEYAHDGKGNIIAVQIRQDERRSPRWIIGDDLAELGNVIGDPFGLIAPVSYFGKVNVKKNAHSLFAFAIDIDYVTVQHLRNLLKQFRNGVQLSPTFLISSGRGLHLYYFLKEPLPMYAEYEKACSELKKAFIRRLWNDTSSLKGEEHDIAGVTQGFRAVGSQSKLGEDFPVRAYRISENRYTPQDIKDAIPSCNVDLAAIYGEKIPLQTAILLYPDWWSKKQKAQEKKERQYFAQNRRVYDWWKRKMQEEVRSGGRYYSLMALCSFGLKCGVPEREIRRDAMGFLDYFESITEDPENHFTESDVKDALKALKKGNRQKTLLSTRQWIEEQTKVKITPQVRRRPKGERLKQEDHLKVARAARDARDDLRGRKWNGRKSKAAAVARWRAEHPEGSKSECRKETGLSYPTIRKHWEAAEQKTAAVIRFNTLEELNAFVRKMPREEILKIMDELAPEVERLHLLTQPEARREPKRKNI